MLAGSLGAVTIPTAHVDNSRTGANTAERLLTPTNVAGGTFGLRGTYSMDGFVYAQPLYVPGVTVAGISRTCLITATMHNTVSCFNADRPSTAALWSVSLGTSYPLASTPQGNLLYGTEVGIASTPVADPANNLLYVVRDTTGPVWTLYKLNLSTGATISSVNITHAGFDPQQQLQRAALTLANGQVYVCFGSYSDVATWFGWIFAYDAAALTQTAFFKTHTTNGAGLWGSSGGPSVDGSGNLYMLTGNGTWNGTTDWGESILKWDANLNLTDWFTPSNGATLNTNDSDLSSGRAMLVPGSTVLVSCAKDFRVYNVDRTNLGHLQGTGAVPQLFPTDPGGVISVHSGCYGGTFINSHAYFPNTAGQIYAFSLSGTTFNTTPVTSSASFEYPGAQMSSSSNGSANTIIWATTVATSALFAPEIMTLRAFDASLNQIYSDTQSASMSKFVVPVVADGRVFVASQSNLIYVYGLPVSSQIGGQAVVSGQVVGK